LELLRNKKRGIGTVAKFPLPISYKTLSRDTHKDFGFKKNEISGTFAAVLYCLSRSNLISKVINN
jgi:hypothetical protein